MVCSTGIGAGGAISGLHRFLKPRHPVLRIVAAEPADSPILSRGMAGKHKIMGTAPGFIPDALDTNAYQQLLSITTAEAFAMTRRLAAQEGIFCGISCGAAVSGMLKLAAGGACQGRTVLAILPDTGERYLSTEVWQ